MLLSLIEITAASINDGRPMFENVFKKEPVFYRKYFRPWVTNAINEAVKMQAAIKKATDPNSR